MASIEMVEKLRQRANVTFEEAREALDRSGGDMLEAVIYLEKNGKIPPPRGGHYSTGDSGDSSNGEYRDAKSGHKGRNDYYYDSDMKSSRKTSGASPFLRSVWQFFAKVFHIGNNTLFEVTRRGDEIIKIPLTVLVIAAIVIFHITAILLIAGLFFGFRYRLVGKQFNGEPINSAMNSASNAAESLKDAINKNLKN